MKYCSNCGSQLADGQRFCHECGQALNPGKPSLSATPAIEAQVEGPDESRPKIGSTSPAQRVESSQSLLKNIAVPDELTICVGCFKGYRADRLQKCPVCGVETQGTAKSSLIDQKRPAQFYEKWSNLPQEVDSGYKTVLKVGAGILAVFFLIFLIASHSQTRTSTSYKLGYQNGLQLSAANSFFLLSGQPIDICNMVLSLGQNGTTNDGINWQNINSDEFDAGCMDAYADTHGGLRTTSIPATSNP